MKNTKDKRNSREDIIQIAELLLYKKPVKEITLSEIGKNLNVGHTAIYKHFENKQVLWTAVGINWFKNSIIQEISHLQFIDNNRKKNLKNWVWTFITLKHDAYRLFPNMAEVTIMYIDNDPKILGSILTDAYLQINQIMNYDTATFEKAETIMTAFTLFTIPLFKNLWNEPDLENRFEKLWRLIEQGL